MEVIHQSGDYHIFIRREEIERITNIDNPATRVAGSLRYPWLEAVVLDVESKKPTEEWLALTCSNDSHVAQSPNGIVLKRLDKEGKPRDINVFVFTPRLMRQEELGFHKRENSPDFHTIYTHPENQLMTRYDGENKLYLSINSHDLRDVDFEITPN